ncbi:MAG TPA: hypothetical protein VLD39_06195 [Gammaproteobacteria bacterium]|nr:hypothetical protein [Gammaproteobacteria bacterium]
MREIMYDHSSFLIVTILFVVLLAAVELGYRIGWPLANGSSKSMKNQILTIQGSLLGVLALLLGFTFSLALQRYDARSQAVVSEANAIGTAILRSELLPPSVRAETRELLGRYLDSRVDAGVISLDLADDRRSAMAASNQLLSSIWQLAARAAAEDPNPVSTGLYIQSLNELIDSFGVRDAALNRHVPELVLFLLFGTFTLTACLVGYASGLSGHRASFPTYIMLTLIVFLVFLIIDLDRPRRGLISVSQQPMLDLQATMVGSAAAN